MYSVRAWWLDKAKSLFVGEQIRCKHPHDSGRASVVIRNTETSYSAYCHRRNTGDTVHKAHVIPRVAPQGSEHDSIPKDLVYVETLPNHQQRQIYSYVLTKGVSPEMLPRLKWTESRKRIIFETSQGIVLGRDITEDRKSTRLNSSHVASSYPV